MKFVFAKIPPIASQDRSHVHASLLLSGSGSLSTHWLQLATTSMNVATVLEAGIDICSNITVLNLVPSRQINRLIPNKRDKYFGFDFFGFIF